MSLAPLVAPAVKVADTSAGILPVVVVGGGPTGLTAALELAYQGVPCTVLDEGRQGCEGSRAIAIHQTALAFWEKLGCAGPMLAEGVAWRIRHTFLGEHELYSQVLPTTRPGELPTFLNLQQYRTEDCLIRRIATVPSVDLRWEHRVVGISQDSGGATLEAETPHGPIRLRCRYVLACDGARSSMRKLLGLSFPGTTYSDRFLIADIRANLPLPLEPRFFFNHPTNPGSTILIHPQPDDVWRIDWQLRNAVDAVGERTPEALSRRIRALIGEIPYELVWLSAYRFHQRLLDRLRHGRVFFLGDAAHLMAPFGARGMNSSIQDVENLGWKLAWVLRGEAPETLLDTYQIERWSAHYHDQIVTRATMRFMSPHTVTQKVWRTVALKLSTHSKRARQWVNSGKMAEPFTYPSSPILVPDEAPHRVWQGAPIVGSKAPDGSCVVVNGRGGSDTNPIRLRQLVGQKLVILYFAADHFKACRFAQEVAAEHPIVPATLWPLLPDVPDVLPDLPMVWDHVGELERAFTARPGTLFLIRPDGYVAARRRHAKPEDVIHLLRLASGASVS